MMKCNKEYDNDENENEQQTENNEEQYENNEDEVDSLLEQDMKIYSPGFDKNIVKHLKDIESKYLHNEDMAEIGFMFIPAESIYSYIYANMQSVIELSYKLKVYIVSPTTLMAYITAYKAINLDIKRNERLKDIQNEYLRLSNEFQRFEQRSEQVFNDYDRMYKDIRLLKITSNKLIKRFKEIELVELDSKYSYENRKKRCL